MRIQGRPEIPLPTPTTEKKSSGAAAGAAPADGASFTDVLVDSLTAASAQEQAAQSATEAMLTGEGGIHEAVIAQEKAAISVRYAVTLKNRAVEAYREIMNTQV